MAGTCVHDECGRFAVNLGFHDTRPKRLLSSIGTTPVIETGSSGTCAAAENMRIEATRVFDDFTMATSQIC
jgi:hypothetical protein